MAMDQRLSLEHFRAFVTVVECGSFSTAAQRLLRTQSALTHQIRRMEEILGERLLLRTRGHFTGLTEEGARFLPRARGVLGMVETARRSVGQRALTGRVRVGVMDDFDIRWLIKLIGRFEAQHPGVETSTVSDLSVRLEERLASGEIDLALVKRLSDTNNPPARVLRVERLRWVCGDQTTWEGLGPAPLVLFHHGCVYRGRVFDLLASKGIPSRIAYEGHSYANVRTAVAAGLGFAALPEGQINGGVQAYAPMSPASDLPDLGCVELVARVDAEREDSIVDAFVEEVERHLNQPLQETRRLAN